MPRDIDIRIDTRELDRLIRELPGNRRLVVRKVAFAVKARARLKAPVDTGALYNSIYVRLGKSGEMPAQGTQPLPQPGDDDTAHVGPSVDYGGYVEFGTSKMGAQPYLQPAVNDVAEELRSNPQQFVGHVFERGAGGGAGELSDG